MPALVEAKNASYSIGGRLVLRRINLTVEEGETVILLGRSGSGKTTLLKTINRMIHLTGGEIRFQDKLVQDWNPIALRRKIGYVIQDGGLFPHVTVAGNIGLVPGLEGWPENKIRARTLELLETVKLPASYLSRYPRELSGGEKQRVGIARALAANPPLLLFDEPFAALDPVTRFDLQRQFLELRKTLGKTSIFVTHDIREALLLGSRIALLKNGELEMVVTPDEFTSATSEEASAFLATLEKPAC